MTRFSLLLDEAAPPPAPEQRSQEFVPVQGGGETTSAETLLVAAYALMWLMVFAFVLLTWRRQRSIEARLGDLERSLGAAPGGHRSTTDA